MQLTTTSIRSIIWQMMGPWVSEPKLDGGGVLGPMGDTPLKTVSSYIPVGFTFFPPCGTNLFLRLCRTRGIAWRVRSNRVNQDPLIWWISVHQIIINVRAQRRAVDRVSNIERWLFNRVIGEPQRNMLLLKVTAMKIGWAINKEIVGSWPIKIVQSQPSIVLRANRMVCDFCNKIPIKRCSSPCKHKFGLNCEEIKGFRSKFASSS